MREAIRAAAEPLRVPGSPEWQVLSPVSVGEIARAHGQPRWAVEAAALEAEIVPLHTMRNLARFTREGQIRLLRSVVAVVGDGPPLIVAMQRLGQAGVGRLRHLAPAADAVAEDAVARAVAGANASVEVTRVPLDLRRGDPAALLEGAAAAVACLEDSMDETLLAAACRRPRLPLVCAAVGDTDGQVTVIFPGDRTLARIYRPEHPHLPPSRPGSTGTGGQSARMVGTWMADQVLSALLDHPDLLRHQLLYADLQTGQMVTTDLKE
jgi:molybdopterin/thiamine biosynthesis adenylyltransferase